jgi:predicted metal-dependent phosphoesterase TrpH
VTFGPSARRNAQIVTPGTAAGLHSIPLEATASRGNERTVLKVELHSHTADDPSDYIPHSTYQLIDRSAELGYDALAITLHDRQLDLRPYADYARQRGVTLIPGIERTIEGKHVLLLNFSRATEAVKTFDDLAHLRANEGGLVVAPHPYFPSPTCLGKLLESKADLFDAVEYNGMFTAALNFNERAARWAMMHGKPLVGNGDVHRLRQLGTTYSLVDAAPDANAICEAIRCNRVWVEAAPVSVLTAAGLMAELFAANFRAGADRSHSDERGYSTG